MEPNDDINLTRVLHEWKAPDAPDSLRPPSRPSQERSWMAWLRRDIRVPVPVAIAVAATLMWLASNVSLNRGGAVPRPTSVDDLRGFEPVDAVNVRIERRSDATR